MTAADVQTLKRAFEVLGVWHGILDRDMIEASMEHLLVVLMYAEAERVLGIKRHQWQELQIWSSPLTERLP